MNAAFGIQLLITANAGDVARLSGGKTLENLKDRLGRVPPGEHLATTPVMRDKPEYVEVAQRLTRRARDLFHQANPPLAVDKRTFLFAPAGGRQD